MNNEENVSIADLRAFLAEFSAEWAVKMKEMREARAEADKRRDADFEKLREAQAKTEKMIGGISYNQGKFAEEYFFNSFDRGKQNFFGEKFDSIKQNLKGTETEDEFDIVMLNGGAVGIIEVKFKAHKNDIPDVLKKVATFRDNFPKYKNHKAYIGIATMAFYPELEQECENQGIAIVKQVGDTVVINDKHLKVF